MFKPDQPIKSAKEDLLGRASFSQAFSRALLEYQDKASIVAALYGDWGSGKSSVVNMVLEAVEESAKELKADSRPIIVQFNPWNYADQNQLISQFFKVLSSGLKRKDYGSELTKVSEKLETYSQVLIPLSMIAEPTGVWLIILLLKILGVVSKAARALGTAYSKDAAALKEELSNILGKQERKIIIVIDDIDRLNNSEIRQIFQLIKMLGDFPNTVYLLAFDRNVVTNALSKVQEGAGADYLEKIVQFSVELPPISRTELEKLLFSQLDELIRDLPEERWDQMYWGNVYHSGIKHYFETIRHVTRYINLLKFSFQMVREDVNPIDFIGITCLQVFEPELYYGIRDNKDVFSGVLFSGVSAKDAEIKQATKRCDEVLSRANVLGQEQLKDFLCRLFPKLESYYHNTFHSGESLEGWRREGRICHPDVFEVYFKLALPAGEIPDREMKALLTLAEDRDTFAEALLKLITEGRSVRFLERLEDYTKEFVPERNVQNIVSVLMDIGDSFPEGKAGMFELDTPMRILRVIYQLCHRLPSQEERFNLLQAAINATERSLYTVVHEVAIDGQQHGKATSKQELEPLEKRTVNPEQLEELERLALKKIETWASDGRLGRHPHLASILYCWERWAKPDSSLPKEFIRNLLQTDEGLVAFVAAFSGKSVSHGMGDYVSRISWKTSLKSIGDFVPVKEIEQRVRSIVASETFAKLEERQRMALKAFVDTLDGKVDDR
jgi:predicted KAP-like P-loop ATPase